VSWENVELDVAVPEPVRQMLLSWGTCAGRLRLFSRFMAIGVRNERVSPAFRRPASGSAQPAVAVQSATGRQA
jgi:hypothetical protein